LTNALFTPDSNDVKLVSALLEYEYNNGVAPVRLSYVEIRERLHDIAEDVLIYALEHLVLTKARFRVSKTLCILKLVDDMYLMVPVTAKLIPLSTDEEQRASVVDLIKKPDSVREDICEIDDEVDAFTEHSDRSDKVVEAAVDAVIDRKSHKELIALAVCGRSSVLASMRRGGLMQGTVVSSDGKGYDLSTSANVAALPTVVGANSKQMICRLSGDTLILTTGHRGKSCNNLKNTELETILQEASFTTDDTKHLPKKSMCRLIELHYRIEARLLRPGRDAT